MARSTWPWMKKYARRRAETRARARERAHGDDVRGGEAVLKYIPRIDVEKTLEDDDEAHERERGGDGTEDDERL